MLVLREGIPPDLFRTSLRIRWNPPNGRGEQTCGAAGVEKSPQNHARAIEGFFGY